jgi:hypothetical protein
MQYYIIYNIILSAVTLELAENLAKEDKSRRYEGNLTTENEEEPRKRRANPKYFPVVSSEEEGTELTTPPSSPTKKSQTAGMFNSSCIYLSYLFRNNKTYKQ